MIGDKNVGEVGVRTTGIFPTPITHDSPFIRMLLRIVYFRRDVEKPSNWSFVIHRQVWDRIKSMCHAIVRPAGSQPFTEPLCKGLVAYSRLAKRVHTGDVIPNKPQIDLVEDILRSGMSRINAASLQEQICKRDDAYVGNVERYSCMDCERPAEAMSRNPEGGLRM